MTQTNTQDLFDSDISFNPPIWREIIETQSELFTVRSLLPISDRLRKEFHEGHAAGRAMPTIQKSEWVTPLLAPYEEKTIGYDLPCLLSADRPTCDRIMMCAQDPLRKTGEPIVTVGTFFGIDDRRCRSRRHYRPVWDFIRLCVLAGYDVWVTDAIKLFAGKGVVQKDRSLIDQCYSVLEAEIEAFRPTKVIGFGKVAQHSLRKVSRDVELVPIIHPAARAKGAFKDRVQIYYQAVFGADAPPQ